MRLSLEQLKQGLLHPNKIVRSVVLRHLNESFVGDAETTRLAIQGVELYTWKEFVDYGHQFTNLPLVEESSVEWVCQQIESEDAQRPSDIQKSHLMSMLAEADISLLVRHQSRLLELDEQVNAARPMSKDSSSFRGYSDRIRRRCELAETDPEDCWKELLAHCESHGRGKDFADADVPGAELLLEPLVRAGDRFVPQMLEILQRPFIPLDKPHPDQWLMGLMVILAGKLRCEQAVPHLWRFWAQDWDWYNPEVQSAYIRIGTPAAVEHVRDHFPGSEWYIRLFAHGVFENVRCEESITAIEQLLPEEEDDDIRCLLGVAAAFQFDDRAMPTAIEVYDEAPDDPERGVIREIALIFSYLSGWALPQRDRWEREIADELKRQQLQRRRYEAMMRGTLNPKAPLPNFNATPPERRIISPAVPISPREDFNESPAPVVKQAAGRNDPCPCGSGKKYKKCCLKS